MTCPLCSSNTSHTVGVKDSFEIVQCESCDLYYTSPIPSDEDIFNFYQNYVGTSRYTRKILKKTISSLLKILYIRRFQKTKGGSFLDVGCNVGIIVNAAQLLGYKATGIDLDTKSIEYAQNRFKKSEFLATGSNELSHEGREFDVVYCTSVIEHTPHIHEFVAALKKLLATGGVLYLTTPDTGHWKVPKDFLSWRMIVPPEHLVWFNKKNISRILEEHGMEVIKIMWSHRSNMRVIARAK